MSSRYNIDETRYGWQRPGKQTNIPEFQDDSRKADRQLIVLYGTALAMSLLINLALLIYIYAIKQ